MQKIYLDYNATTPILPEVFNVMKPYLTEKWGNPSSSHWAGESLQEDIEKARISIAKSLNCPKDRLFFTSCGTESINWAIKMSVIGSKKKKKHIITSKVEHAAVLETVKFLKKFNVEVSYLDVDYNGRINVEDIKRSINENTVLISIMMANNETGVLFPVDEIGKIARENDILFHIDGVQAYGKIKVDLKEIAPDFFSISGHKVYSPKGIGVLYAKNISMIEPLIHGGGQENGARSGTENVPYIVALGKSAEIISSDINNGYLEKIKEMRDYIEKRLCEELEQVEVNGAVEERVPNTLNVSFMNIETSALIKALSYEGIAISAGSACASHKESFSHVLKAMGKTKLHALSAVRISIGKGVDFEQIKFATERIIFWVKKLRSFSPEKV